MSIKYGENHRVSGKYIFRKLVLDCLAITNNKY